MNQKVVRSGRVSNALDFVQLNFSLNIHFRLKKPLIPNIQQSFRCHNKQSHLSLTSSIGFEYSAGPEKLLIVLDEFFKIRILLKIFIILNYPV